MAFAVGAGKGVRPSMNVTPLVVVVLVLLIIFMVITPLLARELGVQVPPEPEADAPPPSAEAPVPVVLAVSADGKIVLNRQDVAPDQVAEQVRRALSSRGEKVVFFDAADDAPYGSAVAALDGARAGGAEVIAVLPDKLDP
jgi:biopolymer transport protein ExbD